MLTNSCLYMYAYRHSNNNNHNSILLHYINLYVHVQLPQHATYSGSTKLTNLYVFINMTPTQLHKIHQNITK